MRRKLNFFEKLVGLIWDIELSSVCETFFSLPGPICLSCPSLPGCPQRYATATEVYHSLREMTEQKKTWNICGDNLIIIYVKRVSTLNPEVYWPSDLPLVFSPYYHIIGLSSSRSLFTGSNKLPYRFSENLFTPSLSIYERISNSRLVYERCCYCFPYKREGIYIRRRRKEKRTAFFFRRP